MQAIQVIESLFLDVGAGWVIWLLGLLSVASLAIAVERALFYRARKGDVALLCRNLDRRLRSGDWNEAIRELDASGSVAGAIAAAGLRLRDRGPAAVDRAMQSASALERTRLERWLAFLGTLGNNAPFIGLFGTVVGVVGAFEKLGAQGHAALAGSGAQAQVASAAVMAHIAEALVATAVGILVALPAVAAHNYFQRRIAALLSGAEVLTNLVLAYLQEKPEPLAEAA